MQLTTLLLIPSKQSAASMYLKVAVEKLIKKKENIQDRLLLNNYIIPICNYLRNHDYIKKLWLVENL